MAAEKLITEHLDLWTAAIKRKSAAGRGSSSKVELYGIKKLRELILQLAVMGKLVPQDPNDEPASKLLKRIAAEKAKLVKEGKIKKEKPLRPIGDDEAPFSLPFGWSFRRLGEILSFEYGDNLPNAKRSGTGEYPVYGSNGIVGSHNEQFVPEKCIVIGRKGSAGALNLCLAEGCCVTDVAYYCIPPADLSIIFVFKMLHTIGLDRLGKGIKPGLNRNEAYALIVPIPPLAEQHRIVAKVDELMVLCDQLEQQTDTSLSAHQTLVETLLNALANSADHSQFASAWQRIAEHFDTLFTTEESIDQLKQTIMELAVMGKLAPQDPNDEPASELLMKIANKKARLEEIEGLRTSASATVQTADQYLLTPNTWAWIRLGNLAKFIDYRGKTPKKIESGVRLITAKNIRYGYIDTDPEEFISSEDYDSWMTRGFPKLGDTLFTTEAPLGNAANIALHEKFALAQRSICFQWHELRIGPFMLLQILAKPFQDVLIDNATGMTATGIKASKLKEIPVTLPPLQEQHRIVAKVDELMALCDQLKSRLNDAQTTQLLLADALTEKALARM